MLAQALSNKITCENIKVINIILTKACFFKKPDFPRLIIFKNISKLHFKIKFFMYSNINIIK